MQRIWIIGPCGAGKSTLAKALGKRTGLPVVHLDKLYWQPGWVLPEQDALQRLSDEAAADEHWIIEGNWTKTAAMRMERADTVVLLDVGKWVYRRGVIARWLKYRGRVRSDMAAGCQEKVDWEFWRYTWRFHKDRRPGLMEIMVGLRADQAGVHLRSRREMGAWLDSVGTGA